MTTKHDKTSALSSRETILFSLEVVEGPMDGALLSGALSRVRIGRIPGNDFELHSDRSVSGEHAVLARRAGHRATVVAGGGGGQRHDRG